MRPTLDEALHMRLQAAVDEGWLHVQSPPDHRGTASIEDLAVVIKTALADTFDWLMAEAFSALLVELFRARAFDSDTGTTHVEVLAALENALMVTRYIEPAEVSA